jgi:hypothetical protein
MTSAAVRCCAGCELWREEALVPVDFSKLTVGVRSAGAHDAHDDIEAALARITDDDIEDRAEVAGAPARNQAVRRLTGELEWDRDSHVRVVRVGDV